MGFLQNLLQGLDKLGVNTRRLQWKLYQWEQRRSRGFRMPARLHWLKYPHKFCRRCGAVNDREARTCSSCEARLPSKTGYLLMRLAGVALPAAMPATVGVFLTLMVLTFAVGVALDGPQGLWAFSSDTLLRLGGWGAGMLAWPQLYWRMLGFGLVHAGIIHILFNGFALSQIGPALESQIGRSRMLVLVTLTQLASAAASALWGVRLTVGASGWVFGLIGFGITYFHSMGPAGRVYRDLLLHWALYALVFGLLMSGSVNNAAHVGGMAAGLALGFMPPDHPRRRAWRFFWDVGFWVAAPLWLVTLACMALSIVRVI